ncbi:M23 family metallopeptidase [Alkaliphilus peptidifermentans]|uniref:Peptidase family M23 n=1 Tax=Alkaliphilus peptidifermentans DSM 18978 TaxID=1120976 RepID=A0A1G5FDE0_9FIRM|nr:M23 family metallopeptidase [Alkaliphilus peptidifermentans]SCY37197.1 Peptidase family M23 [Alkaliphilus peptidifermentans DSM 18978]
MKRFIPMILILLICMIQPFGYGDVVFNVENDSMPYQINVDKDNEVLFTFDDTINKYSLALYNEKKELYQTDSSEKVVTVKNLPKDIVIDFIISYDTASGLNNISGSMILQSSKGKTNLSYSTISFYTEVTDREINTLSSTRYESEPNDTFASANRIYDDENVYGYISSRSDVDYFKIKFTQAGKANFWLGSIPSGCDYDLEVYDSSQNLLKGSYKGGNSDELISQITIEPNKDYYIKVYSYTGYDAADSYHLRAKLYADDDYGAFGWEYMYTDTDFRHISSGYKLSDRPTHYGIDIVSSNSSNHISEAVITNVYDGKIIIARYSSSAGYYVVVETDSIDPNSGNKLRVRYLHMKEGLYVAEGFNITTGAIIGLTGNTGDVRPKPTLENPLAGTHLHFDVNKSGKNSNLYASDTVNPQWFFPSITFTGKTSDLE